jgi:ribonuclease P protein component
LSKFSSPQHKNLKTPSQFSHFFKTAKKIQTPYFIFYFNHKQNTERSFAYITSKKIGNAVERNTAKRKLRELARHLQHHINKRFDCIFIAKKKPWKTVSLDTQKNALIPFLQENELWLD